MDHVVELDQESESGSGREIIECREWAEGGMLAVQVDRCARDHHSVRAWLLEAERFDDGDALGDASWVVGRGDGDGDAEKGRDGDEPPGDGVVEREADLVTEDAGHGNAEAGSD